MVLLSSLGSGFCFSMNNEKGGQKFHDIVSTKLLRTGNISIRNLEMSCGQNFSDSIKTSKDGVRLTVTL